MAYDLEEQEQLEGLKAFWRQYGNFVLTVVTAVLLAIAAYRAFGWYQGRQAAEAAVAYDALQAAVEKKDVAKIKEAAGVVFEKYSGTVYAEMTAFVAARAYVDAGDLKSAKAPLQWAVDHAKDDEFRSLSRIRLAGVLLDEKNFDEALKLVSGDVPAQYAAAFADRRGDVLVAQGKVDDARAAYKLALDKLGPASPLRRLVQLKLDGLGGAAS
jgi:predicted negative regulator of RcsB-dependent stress response